MAETTEIALEAIDSQVDEKLVNLKETDYKEEEEQIPIGSIVSTYAHPFSEMNANVLISSYLHFTPPLMIVSEKKYGSKYNSVSGELEDNDSYKCFFYSTLSGAIEENWFKRKELKFINQGDPSFFKINKDSNLEVLKRKFFGRMAIASTVDFELGKQRIWAESEDKTSKLKISNLLDYLPPFGTIIDIKYNDDYQKYAEKEGKISHRKSKLLVKLRWLNNTTAKYSEDYFPMVGLKLIEKEDLELKNYNPALYYLMEDGITLEGVERGVISRVPVRFERVIWNHYYYIYSFTNLFTQSSIETNEVAPEIVMDLSHIIGLSSFNWDVLVHFSIEGATNVKDKWYEIEYSDKNERNTRRIIKVIDLIEELQEDQTKKRILQANCLLRNGKIRHFRVSRIKSYRLLSEDFVTTFGG